MINEITITNIVTGKSLDFGNEGKFIIDEIDWDSPSVSFETYRVPFQVGTTLEGVMVGTRKPSITGHVIANITENVLGMKWNEYLEKQEQMIDENKTELDRLISVYQDVRIEANGYYLDARPTQPPKYSTKEKENNEVLCFFTLEFECYKPLFYQDDKLIDLASINPMFHFPLIIPEDEGIVFGEIMRRQSILINNSGDAPIGCEIIMKASGGSITDPKIYNVNTDEYIGFEGLTLNDGDYLTITTDIGEENAIKHDSQSSNNISVIGNISKGSKFIQILQGSNYYSYEVGEGQENNAEVSIRFTERFFNIRGM